MIYTNTQKVVLIIKVKALIKNIRESIKLKFFLNIELWTLKV